MAPRNNHPHDEERDLMVKLVQELTAANRDLTERVHKLENTLLVEIAIIKTKQGSVSGFFGIVGGIVSSLTVGILLNYWKIH